VTAVGCAGVSSSPRALLLAAGRQLAATSVQRTVQLLGATPFSVQNMRDLFLLASCGASARVWAAAPSARAKKN